MSSISSPGGRRPPPTHPPAAGALSFSAPRAPMHHQVHLYQIGRDSKPTEQPQVAGSFDVVADTLDQARAVALARLQAEGATIRSLSFLVDGGLAAVVTQPAPAPTPAQVRRARG